MLDVKLATGSDILRPASDGRVGGVRNRWSTTRSRLRFRLDSRGGKTQFRKGVGTSETSKAGAESTGINCHCSVEWKVRKEYKQWCGDDAKIGWTQTES